MANYDDLKSDQLSEEDLARVADGGDASTSGGTDEVSTTISNLFSNAADQYNQISTEAQNFHATFIATLNGNKP